MKGKLLGLMAGLAIFLCAAPALAEEATIIIPYAVHGGDWWSGLALSNTGTNDITVTVRRGTSTLSLPGHPSLTMWQKVGTVNLKGLSMETRLLPDFFENATYPTSDDGRVMLRLVGEGDSAKSDFKATLFVGNTGADGGFSYQVFRDGD